MLNKYVLKDNTLFASIQTGGENEIGWYKNIK